MYYIKLSKKAISNLEEISREIWTIATKEDGDLNEVNLATELLKQISFEIDHITMYISSMED